MKRFSANLISFCIFLIANSQELDPRAYANLPKGTNAIAIVYGLSSGNVLTDPSLPVAGFKIIAHSIGAGYVHTFALAKKLARIQATIPYTFMSGELQLNGRDTSGVRKGFGDARIRFGINLIGSPALAPKDFRQFKQKTIVGLSFVVTVPTGLYYKDKRINLGSNRWAFKPEIGVSRKFERFYVEAYSGVWFYTHNNAFLVSKTLEQEAVLSFQVHANYYFKNQMWVGINGNFFNGGETFVEGQPSGDLKDNWRIGATLSIPLAPKHSMKLQFHVGAFTNAGYDYDLVSIGYQFVFF